MAKILLFAKAGLTGEEYVVLLDESDDGYDNPEDEYKLADFSLVETLEVFDDLGSFPTGRTLMKVD